MISSRETPVKFVYKLPLILKIRIFLKYFLVCVVVCCAARQIFALDPRKSIAQYAHRVWTSNDGLPQDSVNAIVQTPDGYLWVATQEGFARFDGVKFTVFDASTTDGLGSFIHTLFVDRAGTLWIGSIGFTSYSKGKFQFYTSADGLPDVSVKYSSEDADGVLWLGAANRDRTSGGKGLTRFENGRGTILTTKNGLSSDQIYQTATDKNGVLWIGTGNGLNVYQDGRFKIYTTADGLTSDFTPIVYKDRAGDIWVGTNKGLNLYRNGVFTRFTTGDGLSDNGIRSIYEDKDGALWVGTDKGLNRIVNGKAQALFGIEELANDRIFSIYEDFEGSLWIGTHSSGLHRLRDAKFTAYGAPEGLFGDSVQSIFQDSAQRLWIGTSDGGLNVWENNRFRAFSAKDGLAGNRVRAIYEDRAGNLWFGTEAGLNKFANGKFEHYNASDGLASSNIRTIYEDDTGALWLGTDVGVSVLKDGKFRNFSSDVLIGTGVNFFYRDARRRLWIASDEGLSIYENGEIVPQKDVFPPEFNAQSVSEDADGTLWWTTWGQGLNRLKDGKLTAYTTKSGLYDNTAWTILDDGKGNLWMGCNRGVFRVAKQELNDFADGKINIIGSIVYGTVNGMRKRETNAGSPAALRMKDGRLWFATTAGAVVINANDIVTNHVAPPMVIENLIADDQSYAPNGERFDFEAGTKNVEFQYVGLSFVAPERVKYKYKLEGFDQNWIDAGARRTAYYTNLAPGDYKFRVIGANNDGVWNEQGASVEFRVLAPFWRAWWFFALVLLVLSVAIFAVFRWRIARLERVNRRQRFFSRQLIESQERERKRIAAELHDNLGQRLIIIKNWASLGLKLTGEKAPARAQLEEISTTALQAIGEVREIIYDLRPVQIETSGLSSTIKFTVEQVAASSGVNLTIECADLDDLFAPEDEVTVYRIVQECLSNAVKHSGAENIAVLIERDGRAVKITVADDGKGFVADAPLDADRRAGFGLNGLNERVKMLGGSVQIQSVIGKGTTVFVEIEAPGD